MDRYTGRNERGDLLLCGNEVGGNNQDIYNALSRLEEYEDADTLTCKGCANFSEDGFTNICWGCRRNREIPDYYIKPEEIEKKRKELMEMKYFEIKQPYYALIKAEDKETAQSRYFYSLSEKVDCSQFGDTELQFCEIPRNRAIKKFISAGYPAQEIYNAKARVLLLDASAF